MKNIIRTILLVFTLILPSSCLKMGLDKDLPVFTEAEMSKPVFEYRWYDDSKGLGHMVVARLHITDVVVDSEKAEISLNITVPAANDKLPAAEREKVSLANLVFFCDISTGAIMQPVGNAPKPGAIGDFTSKKVQYEVQAASGDTKVWTIKILSFNK